MRESAKHGHVINSSASVNSDMSEILTAAFRYPMHHLICTNFCYCFSLLTIFYTHAPWQLHYNPKRKQKNILLVGDLEDDSSGNLAFFKTFIDAVEPISRRP